ncbi:MAG: hypothetical protein ABW127_06260, partial [Candidatus Thiodiazotropha endolucinida]
CVFLPFDHLFIVWGDNITHNQVAKITMPLQRRKRQVSPYPVTRQPAVFAPTSRVCRGNFIYGHMASAEGIPQTGCHSVLNLCCLSTQAIFMQGGF